MPKRPSAPQLSDVSARSGDVLCNGPATRDRADRPRCAGAGHDGFGDQAYRFECDVDDDIEAGVLLFHNRRLCAGLGRGAKEMVMYRYGLQHPRGEDPGQCEPGGDRLHRLPIRMLNDRNILTIHTSADHGRRWQKFDVHMEVSGYHHNVAHDSLSLRPALYAADRGEARFRDFRFEALA